VTTMFGWDFMQFDFEATPSRARVHRLLGEAAWAGGAASVTLRARYTDQDYGETPDALLVDSPERNLWLQGRDTFSIADIAGMDRRAYGGVTVRGEWTATGKRWVPADAHAEAGASGRGFLQAMEYGWLEGGAEWTLGAGIYALVDGRLARYDHSAWGGAETFAAGYVEAGWRYRALWINLGYGYDPVVFDPVINDYAHIGRNEVVRSALGDSVRRSGATSIGARVLDEERALEDAQAIKLECVVRF